MKQNRLLMLTALLLAPRTALHAGRTLPEVPLWKISRQFFPTIGKLRRDDFQ